MCKLRDCKIHKRVGRLQLHKIHTSKPEKQNSSKRYDAIVQPSVEDPVVDDRIPVGAGAEMIPHTVKSLPSLRN